MKVGRDFFVILTEGHTPANTGGMVDLSPEFIVEKDELKGAIAISPNAGSPSTFTVTLAGTYAVGDKIVVSIQSNDRSTQLWTKAYTHVVQAGSTSVTAIATAITAKIAADGMNDAPYTATSAAGVITIVAKTNDKRALARTVYTNSSAGTIVASAVATTISEGQPQDLIDKGVDPSLINLASYDTVRIDYEADAPIGDIDASVPFNREIYWYGTVGEGATLATLINTP
jgi:phage tail sheath gpL-like